MKPITLYITVQSEDTTLVEITRKYTDIDSLEMYNDALAYQIAEIARDELARIRKEKFLLDNPELNIGGLITNSDPF